MIDKDYSKPDFPIVSNPFDDPKSPKTFSTELENTDRFDTPEIFDLGFLRSNPQLKIYQHKDKPELYLEEKHDIDFSVKDRIVRIIVVYSSILNLSGSTTKTFLYFKSKPDIAEIQKIIDNY